ncbi:MAG TPA: hypothetical protein VGC04_10620 [Cellulomonas sp.]
MSDRLYLGVHQKDSDRDHAILLTSDPLPVLAAAGGRVSPVFLVHGPELHDLPEESALLICFPAHPAAYLAAIKRPGQLGPEVTGYITHGLASVVLVFPTTELASRFGRSRQELLVAAEVWQVFNGTIRLSEMLEIDHCLDAGEEADVVIPCEDLDFAAATEIRQLNLNLTLFWNRIKCFVPEYGPLVQWVHDIACDSVDKLHAFPPAAGDELSTLTYHQEVGLLIELNSCLTQLASQASSIMPPILEAGFPVGEFSLFGIGSASRAVWRLYDHINTVFANANILGRLQLIAHSGPVDPGIRSLKTGRSSDDGVTSISGIDPTSPRAARRHIVYFSSRWGFHQTLNSLTISWQCINACAAREWNLLTISHEFLHAQFRELVAVVFGGSQDAVVQLANDYNSARTADPANFMTSLRTALLHSMYRLEQAEKMANVIRNGARETNIPLNEYLSTKRVVELVHQHLETLDEFVVHILDFLYFYDGDEDLYVSSLWHSWALVPGVARRPEHYILRTLLALAATYRDEIGASEAFGFAVATLREKLHVLLDGETHPLIETALGILGSASPESEPDTPAFRELRQRFLCSYGIVEFVRAHLVDRQLHSQLIDDGEAVPDSDFSYPLETGEFPDFRIGSPVRFLLDRFSSSEQAGDPGRTEFASLWQLLLLD